MIEIQYLEKWWANKIYSKYRTPDVEEFAVFRRLLCSFKPSYWPGVN